MRKLMVVCGIILALLLVFSSAAVAAPPARVDVIIGFDQKPGPSEEGLVRGCGGEIKYTYSIVPAIAASIPETAIQGLLRNPRVTGIEPNIIFHAVDDGEYPWGVLQIGAYNVHNLGNEGSAIKVAVIDTGIDYRHPELRDAYAGGYDFVNGDSNPMDDNGHGTHVAGTIAAALNGEGVVGVAPGVELYALKVLDSNGTGNLYDIIAALDWACGNNRKNIVVQITNNSYGSPVDDASGLLQLAFDLSYSNPFEDWNLLHVAAAGNSGTDDETVDNVGFPAKYDSVIAVAATDQSNNRAYFPSIEKYSSTGEAVELAASGVNILSTFLNRSYAWGSGTSMACPHVVGTAALVMASPETVARDANNDGTYETNGDGAWSNIEVRALLQATADDLGTTGKDNVYGYGLVDADEAVCISPFTDVAITAVNAPDTVVPGELANIDVTIENVGNQDVVGDINVTLTDETDGTTIGTQTISGGLAANASPTLTYTWDTSSVSLGNHILTASHDFVDDNNGNDSESTVVNVNEVGGVTVSAIMPPEMPTGTTIPVTITGSGFADGADITFENGSGPAPTASNTIVVDSNTITAEVTAKSGGPPRNRLWDVRVTNPDGASDVLVDGFTVTP